MFKDAKDYDIKLPHHNLGRTHTAEHRANNCAAQKGKTLSKETRAKISAANLGKTLSEENKAKLLAANLGKTTSAETKAKISASLKGRPRKPHTAESRAKMSAAFCKYVYYTPAGGPFTRNEAIAANNSSGNALVSRCKRKTFPDWYRVKKVDNT